MRYEITERARDVEIHVSGAAGRTPELLQSLEECRSGHCGCPTDQYDKLAAMDVEAGADEVTVRLEPLAGARLDPDEVRACLDHTTRAGDG